MRRRVNRSGGACLDDPISGYAVITEEGDRIGGSDESDWQCPSPGSGTFSFWAAPIPADTHVRFFFTIPEPLDVTLLIFDENKEIVAVLVDGKKAAGAHAVTWATSDDAGRRLPPGLYRACITAGEYSCHGDVMILEDASEFWSTVR